MTPEVEKIINDYINSPTGKIRQIYPVVEKIDLEYHTNPDVEKSFYGERQSDEWLDITVYLNSPIGEEEDLWDTHNFDWSYMMDYHITNDLVKLFGGKKLPYELRIYAPDDSHWKYITGTGGLTW